MRKILLLMCASLALQCASSMHHYIPGSDNTEYFKDVFRHFKGLGRHCTMEEAQQYTACIFIATSPPICDICIDTVLMGKSNISLVYLKPGENELVLKKGMLIKKKSLFLQEGQNPSLFVNLHGNRT